MLTHKYKYPILLLLVLLASGALKLFFAGKYATYTDELLSAFVAQAIYHTGLPVLPSDTLYPRAPLHHYLLAIPIGLGGIDYFSMRINSVLFSLITILVLYRMGIKVAGRNAALAAALLLSVSSLFSQFALSGRMYMTYGAFYTLSLYFFYGGFVEGKTRWKAWAVVFMAAAMLSSEAGFLLGLVFAFALAVYQGAGGLRDRAVYIAAGVWGLMVWLIMIYKVPGSYQPFTAHSGLPDPSWIQPQMPAREIIGNLIYPWRALDAVLPFSMPFFLAMTVLIVLRGELRRHYPVVVLLPALILESFLTYRVQYRIIVALIPIYLLACCQLAQTFWGIRKEIFRFKTEVREGRPASAGSSSWPLRTGVTAAAVFLMSAAGLVLVNKIGSPAALGTYVYRAFGYHDSRAGQNLEPSYRYLRSHVKPGDAIIVTTVEYGLFFLGAGNDFYYLRQKKTDDGPNAKFVSFEKDREPYYGKPIIDSIEKLEDLLHTKGGTLWVVADGKTDSYVGPELRGHVQQQFERVFDDAEKDGTRVYRALRTSSLEPGS